MNKTNQKIENKTNATCHTCGDDYYAGTDDEYRTKCPKCEAGTRYPGQPKPTQEEEWNPEEAA